MSDQIILREISLETLHLYQCEDHFLCHHREEESEDNMLNLDVNEHQGLEICFIRHKLASIRHLKDDQSIHILASWKEKPIIVIISKYCCKLVYCTYETFNHSVT